MDTITQTITEYASTSAFEHLTEEAVHAAKQRLIDSLGCAVGAHDCEPAQIGSQLAGGHTPGKYPCLIYSLEPWPTARSRSRRLQMTLCVIRDCDS